MKTLKSVFFKKCAQAAMEYLILLGVMVAATLLAFNTLIPKVVSADGKSGSAVKFFSNVVTNLNESHAYTTPLAPLPTP